MSTVSAEQVAEAQSIAPVVCVQNFYNLAHRVDDELIDSLAHQGIAYVPYFPLGGFSPLQSEELQSVATRLGATQMSVALAWLLQRSPNILLIPGTSSLAHLRENVEGALARSLRPGPRRTGPHRLAVVNSAEAGSRALRESLPGTPGRRREVRAVRRAARPGSRRRARWLSSRGGELTSLRRWSSGWATRPQTQPFEFVDDHGGVGRVDAPGFGDLAQRCGPFSRRRSVVRDRSLDRAREPLAGLLSVVRVTNSCIDDHTRDAARSGEDALVMTTLFRASRALAVTRGGAERPRPRRDEAEDEDRHAATDEDSPRRVTRRDERDARAASHNRANDRNARGPSRPVDSSTRRPPLRPPDRSAYPTSPCW